MTVNYTVQTCKHDTLPYAALDSDCQVLNPTVIIDCGVTPAVVSMEARGRDVVPQIDYSTVNYTVQTCKWDTLPYAALDSDCQVLNPTVIIDCGVTPAVVSMEAIDLNPTVIIDCGVTPAVVSMEAIERDAIPQIDYSTQEPCRHDMNPFLPLPSEAAVLDPTVIIDCSITTMVISCEIKDVDPSKYIDVVIHPTVISSELQERDPTYTLSQLLAPNTLQIELSVADPSVDIWDGVLTTDITIDERTDLRIYGIVMNPDGTPFDLTREW